jgi:hypothetical protein
MTLNTAANNRLHQLLGLRLRFCLRGKYSDVFNFIFQINLVDLFWPVPAAATECKPWTLAATIKKIFIKFDNIPKLGIFAF